MDRKLIEALWEKGGAHTLAVKVLIDAAKDQALMDGKPDDAFNLRYSPSIYLLAGFAFELLLKAAYLLHGGDKELGNGGIGHDLLKALNYAEDQGFHSQSHALRLVIETLRLPHMKFYFRYDAPPKFDVIDLDLTHAALDIVTREVRALLW